MKNIFYLFLLSIIICSCNKNSKDKNKDIVKISKEKYFDKLIPRENDTVYNKKWISIHYGNDIIEDTEIYISNYNDTILNQYKLYNKNQIDIKESEYYDLVIWKTKKPHFYGGKITMHTVYENLKLNKANRRTLEFAYCEQTKDSTSLKYIKSTTSNTIDFEFQNYFGNRLQGKLYQLVYRDTIIKGENMLNMRQTKILVDNFSKTVNLFLGTTSGIKEKKFSLKKTNLKLVN
jgi:hypothetical protein